MSVLFSLIAFFALIGILYPTPWHKKIKLNNRWKNAGVFFIAAIIAGSLSPEAPQTPNTVKTNNTVQADKETPKSSDQQVVKAPVQSPEEKVLSGLSGNELAQVKTAISYLKTAHMSKAGLYDQLTSAYGSQMTSDEANKAINHIDPYINWNNLAVLQAKSYRNSGNITGQALIDQLTSQYGGKFTEKEAKYGVQNIDANVTTKDIWK